MATKTESLHLLLISRVPSSYHLHNHVIVSEKALSHSQRCLTLLFLIRFDMSKISWHIFHLPDLLICEKLGQHASTENTSQSVMHNESRNRYL